MIGPPVFLEGLPPEILSGSKDLTDEFAISITHLGITLARDLYWVVVLCGLTLVKEPAQSSSPAQKDENED